MKQTAVEWLSQQILDNWNDIDAGARNIMEFFEQAKAMEKEQIKNAIIHNQNGLLRRKTVLEAEQYYNETYNK
jgi:hypothetical protein